MPRGEDTWENEPTEAPAEPDPDRDYDFFRELQAESQD